MKCAEAQELITGLVDGKLSTQESALITAHIGECAECPKYFSREHALRHLLKDAATSISAPSELRYKILHEQGRHGLQAWLPRFWRALPPVRAIAVQGAVLVALVALPLFTARYWQQSPHSPIVPGIFQSFRQIKGGEISPTKLNDLGELKDLLTQPVDGQFTPIAYDFSTMNIHLVGGLLQEISNRKVLVTVYQGNSSTILCYTFLGFESDAPEIAEVFFDEGRNMNFYQIYYARTGGVMHREGNIICVLMSGIPMPDFLELARSKARAG